MRPLVYKGRMPLDRICLGSPGSRIYRRYLTPASISAKMALRIVLPALLLGLATSGPVKREVATCSLECPGVDSKFQYSEKSSYVYSYEASTSLQMEKSSELTIVLKATLEITPLSKCDMSLQVLDATVKHGALQESSSPEIEDLKRHSVQFSFLDGKIDNLCSHPDDSEDVNNIRRGMLSAFQNSMKTLSHDSLVRETDVLGSCDTEYKIKELGTDKAVIFKTKNIPSCSNHIKGRSGFTAAAYESPNSHFQHLPFLSDRNYSCHQIVNKGLIEEVNCLEISYYNPLANYGYVVKANGQTKLKFLSKKAASNRETPISTRKTLVYTYTRKSHGHQQSEATALLRDLCKKAENLLHRDVGIIIHKLIDIVRGLPSASVHNLYDSLKNKQLCKSQKVMDIFLDSLKAASSQGAIEVLRELAIKHELSNTEVMLWLNAMPFVSDPDEGALQAASPLLSKGFGSRHALLSVASLAHKYCLHNENCESTPGFQSVVSGLKPYLDNNCQSSTSEEEDEIVTALKAFGNLGYLGECKDLIFKCATTTTNSVPVRIAALEAFRRSPCSEAGSSKLLSIYENLNDDDEVRIAAIISLSKCPSPPIIYRISKTYSVEKSKQVEVFTWTYLSSLRKTSDPLKQKARNAASKLKLSPPQSVDITKFSRNFEISNFVENLNLGYSVESNLIHSEDSYLPRSGSLDLNVDIFGSQLKLLEVGARVENLEHELEKWLGPRGLLKSKYLTQHSHQSSESSESGSAFKTRIQALKDKVNLKQKHPPKGTFYIRVLGNELISRRVDTDYINSLRNQDLKLDELIKKIFKFSNIDIGHTLLFLDNTIMIPSVSGRAYKLAVNGSVTLGLKADGKADVRSSQLNAPQFDVNGRFQPSITVDVAATMSIYSENYEPGLKVNTIVNAGQDFELKLDMNKGPSIVSRLNFPSESNEIFSLKREFYQYDHEGEKVLPKDSNHEFKRCTRYMEDVLGLKFCGQMTFPHIYNSRGKPVVPFTGPLEVELVMTKTDMSMTGYEFTFKLPESQNDAVRKFQLSFDTPNSSTNRKFKSELTLNAPGDGTCSANFEFYCPYYTFQADGTYASNSDKIDMKLDATGDGKRKYSFELSMDKDIRGARLAEYRPILTVSFPGTNPVRFEGTFVFSRGRKEQVSFTISSDSFRNEFSLKGNIAKEGVVFKRDSDFQLMTNITINILSKSYKIHSAYKRVASDVHSELSFDYFHEEKGLQSVKLKIDVLQFNLLHPLRFILETEALMSEYPDFNSKLRWDMSSQVNEHLNNDIQFRYGKDFTNDQNLIHLTQFNKLSGDFYSFTKMNFENKLGLKIPALKFDKAIFFTTVYDFTERPKVSVDIGVQVDKDKFIKFEFNQESYNKLFEEPLKMSLESKVIYFAYEFSIRGEIQQTSTNIFQGRTVIQPMRGIQLTADYVYYIRSTSQVFFHEFECTLVVPGRNIPIQQKLYLKRSRNVVQFGSQTDTGNQSPYIVDLKVNTDGPSEFILDIPVLEGKLKVDQQKDQTTIEADFKTPARRITGSGKFVPGDPNTFDLELYWDADGDDHQKVVVHAKSHKESGVNIVTGNVDYAGSVNIAINGKVNDLILHGPHEIRVDFSGNMDPMSIVFSYELTQEHLNSVFKYLRNEAEKLRADLKGKLIQRENHFDFEGGLLLTSPYKAFNGKEIYYRFFTDTNNITHSFLREYRLKEGPNLGYVSKIDYKRRRGWPGQIKFNDIVTLNQKTFYSINSIIEYGGGKYSAKTSFTPSPGRNLNLDTSLEIAARYATFHHSLSTTLQHLQLFRVNAIADLRNKESYKLQSNFDVNEHKIYDLNATLSTRSVTDFDGHVLLFGKYIPSLHVLSKAQNANSITKYIFSMEKEKKELMSCRGEIRKRKRGFNGDFVFNYGGSDFLTIDLNNEVKSQRERNYVIKLVSFSRIYTVSVHYLKEKKTTKHSIAMCRNENENCINIVTTRKHEDGKDELNIHYKRSSVEFNIVRTTEDTDTSISRRLVLYFDSKRYGYSFKYGHEGDFRNLDLAVLLPAREVSLSQKVGFSSSKPSLHTELRLDAEKHPDRKLTLDVSALNQLMTDQPSELSISLNHPVLEKPIDIKAVANYDSSKTKFFEADLTFDYSLEAEDKIVAKLTVEHPEQRNEKKYADVQAKLKVFHNSADEDNLDFTILANATANDNVTSFTMKNIWKDVNSQHVESDLYLTRLNKEQTFLVGYHRPKVNFLLNATAVPNKDLHDATAEVDFQMKYNGEISRAKLFIDDERKCRKLTILGADGGATRKVEMCLDLGSPVLLSVKTTSIEDDMWVFDYSLEVLRRGYGSLNIRHHWNPEFVGGLVFQITQLASELQEAGVGKLPITDSPRYKSISKKFDTKVVQPFNRLVIEEFEKMSSEFLVELEYFRQKAVQYYQMLPSFSTLLSFFETFKPWFKEKLEELYDLVDKVQEDLLNIYKNLVANVKAYSGRLKERCSSHTECNQAMEAVSRMNFNSFKQLFEKMIAHLPENLQNYLKSGGKIKTYLNEAYAAIKPHIDSLMETEYAKESVQYVFKLVRQLNIQYNKRSVQLRKLYKRKKEEILRSEAYKKVVQFFQTELQTIMDDVRELNYQKYLTKLKPVIEELALRTRLPSLRYFFKINALDGERGVLDMDVNFPLDITVLKNLIKFLYSRIEAVSDLSHYCNWKTILVRLKRLSDFNFIPPYREQAIILGQQHFITFDKTFYEFAGECAYLMASDLQDGNFSVFLTPTFSLSPESSGGRQPSLGFLVNNKAVLINLSDRSMKAGDEIVDLPYLSSEFTVTREGNTIVIDDHYGVQVKCHVVYDVCIVTMSGWYFGKTAGLFGTYDYEPSNDFRRPKGQIPNSVTTFSKSWDISKGCKTKNMVQEARVDVNSDSYKLCKEQFDNTASPLSACFSEVKPTPFMGLCYQHLSNKEDKKEALCNVAMAYVMECERNFVELNLPPKCLTCEGPGGSKLVLGEKKKFLSNPEEKTADLLFVVEAGKCNEVLVKDIESLSRSIERELQNERFSDNRYGVVSYDGSGHSPLLHSVRGKVFFSVNDVTEVTNKIPVEKVTNSSLALEALRLAVTYPFRGISSKTLILMSCSACSYDYKSLQYPVIQQILLEHDIYLHVINGQKIRVKKSSKEKDIVGADADTVYHIKDISQRELVGDPSLRAQISLPKDACVALSQDVGGSFFTTPSSSKDFKTWRSLLARRVVKTSSISNCSWCDCTATADHVSRVVCQPCAARRPKLPFTVCNNCHLPGLVTAFYSYVMHTVL